MDKEGVATFIKGKGSGAATNAHSHEHGHGHEHDHGSHEHGHTHEHLEHPGKGSLNPASRDLLCTKALTLLRKGALAKETVL